MSKFAEMVAFLAALENLLAYYVFGFGDALMEGRGYPDPCPQCKSG